MCYSRSKLHAFLTKTLTETVNRCSAECIWMCVTGIICCNLLSSVDYCCQFSYFAEEGFVKFEQFCSRCLQCCHFTLWVVDPNFYVDYVPLWAGVGQVNVAEVEEAHHISPYTTELCALLHSTSGCTLEWPSSIVHSSSMSTFSMFFFLIWRSPSTSSLITFQTKFGCVFEWLSCTHTSSVVPQNLRIHLTVWLSNFTVISPSDISDKGWITSLYFTIETDLGLGTSCRIVIVIIIQCEYHS